VITLNTEHNLSAFAGSERKVRDTSTLTFAFTFTKVPRVGVFTMYQGLGRVPLVKDEFVCFVLSTRN
jgi:hypothetical protein